MRWYWKATDVDVQGASGILRVAIKPRLNPGTFLAQTLGMLVLFLLRINLSKSSQRLAVYAFLFLVGMAATLWFWLSGAEEVEFDGQRQLLTIRRNALTWPRTSEYPLDSVSALEPRYVYDDRDAEPDGLRCRAGNTTISFAKGLNAEQVDRVLAELQSSFPETAHRMLAGNDPFGEHFTTLKLN